MKKRVVFVIVGLMLLLLSTGYVFYEQSIQNGQDTVVKIYQSDENGTPIISPSPIKLISKAGHRNPFNSEIFDYRLASTNPLSKYIPRTNQTVHLKYRSNLTTKQVRHRLQHAKYLQAGTQTVTTPVFNGTQYLPKGHSVGRISVSANGKTWTRLPISYPNVTMKDPILAIRGKTLYLFEGNVVYETTNFSHWTKHTLKLTNSSFSRGRVVGVVRQSNQHATVLLQGRDRTSGKLKLFYGQWTGNQAFVRNWHSWKVPAGSQLVLSPIGSAVYLTVYRNQHIRLYRANKAGQAFKYQTRVKPIKGHRSQINSAGLLKLPHHRYRLIFNEVNTEHVQTGTYYRDLSQKWRPIGKQHRLESDFMWSRFHLSQYSN